jgi:hypothetical protein
MVVEGLTVTLYAGNGRQIKFTVRDQNTAGSPVKDLSGASIRFAVTRISPNGQILTSSPFITKDSVHGSSEIDITNPTGGELTVFLLPGDTDNNMLGDHYFELEAYGGATPVVLATGTLTVRANVVNP